MIAQYYDQLNGWGKHDEFFLECLAALDVQTVADVGCGTGRVTYKMAAQGYNITAIDPDQAAIAYAKQQASNTSITWIVGDSQQLPSHTYDVVTMTANVAQVFITEDSWQRTLQHVYSALQPGGHFLFDTRNPEARVWEDWLNDDEVEVLIDANTGDRLLYWDDYEGMQHNVFTFTQNIQNDTTQQLHQATVQLIFRSQDDILTALNEAGFSTIHIYANYTTAASAGAVTSFVFHAIK